MMLANLIAGWAVGLAADKTKAAEPAARTANSAGYRETEHVKKFYELSRF